MFHLYNFPKLPLELSLRIYRSIQHNAVNDIICVWYKHIAKKASATELILKITNNQEYRMIQRLIPNNFNHSYPLLIDCFNPHVKSVLQYCKTVLSGIEDKEWWGRKLSVIGQSIYTLYNDFNHANIEKQKIYLDICLLYKKINDKFYFTDNFIQDNILDVSNGIILLNPNPQQGLNNYTQNNILDISFNL